MGERNSNFLVFMCVNNYGFNKLIIGMKLPKYLQFELFSNFFHFNYYLNRNKIFQQDKYT